MRLFVVLSVSLSGLAFAAQGADLKAATDDVCHCMAEPNRKAEEVIQQIMRAQAAGDMSQVVVNQGEMMSVMNAATRCFEGLPKKYPEIDQSEELKQKVMAMAEEQCPNPASQFFQQP